jgi:hypothetical protein
MALIIREQKNTLRIIQWRHVLKVGGANLSVE